MSDHVNSLGQPIGWPVPDWQPARRPSRTPLEGRYCRLEPLDPARHARGLFEADSADASEAGWTYLAYGPFATFEEYLSWMTASCMGEDPLFHAVIDPVDGLPLGVASYLRIEPKTGVIEIGHLHFSPRLQKTRAATEAIFLLLQHAFDELGYRRCEWKCDALNEPSRKAAARFGFAFEGIFRQATLYKGRNRDTAWFSITDREWPALRAAFEAWLDPSNFDESGRQRQSLARPIAKTPEH